MLLNKRQILKENKGKCGIYLLTNTLNGKRYIGSSINLGRRLSFYYSDTHMRHVLQRSTMLIYLSILKYGIKSFRLDIVEYCDISILHQRETYYIEKLNPEYNILRIGSSLLGFKHKEISRMKMRIAKLGLKHTAKTRELIRESALLRKRNKHTEETRAKIKAALLGRKLNETTIAKLKVKFKDRVINKLSLETRAKMSQAKLGRRHTEETRAKMSAARQNNPNGTKVLINNIKTGESFKYESISDAAKAIGVSRITIKNYLISNKLLKNTYFIIEGEKGVSQDIVKPSLKLGLISIIVTNINTGLKIEYSSINAASKELNINGPKLKRYMISGKCLENTYYIQKRMSGNLIT